MDIRKLAPWNWFKDEDEATSVPVSRPMQPDLFPLGQLHQELERAFDALMKQAGFPSFGFGRGEAVKSAWWRPSIDIAATDKEYVISVEIAGVEEKDVSLELVQNSLVVRGEKKQEQRRSEGDFYRIERSYGSFRRVLSLPDDVSRDEIDAKFKNGVLTITLPRKAASLSQGKTIEIRAAA